MPLYINYNGSILGEETPVASAHNRGLRYGDGIFETMKLIHGEIQLEKFHFERLFESLKALQFVLPADLTPEFLKEQIGLLVTRNEVRHAARVRLNLFRKNGGLYDLSDHTPEFVIEALPLPDNHLQFSPRGLFVDIYPDARKACDRFAGIKSNNYLPYLMGALFAKQNNLDDALILNDRNRICEATISNVFWVRRNKIFTPPLSEGCIAGVMRRHLLSLLRKHNFDVEEKSLEVDELCEAEEVFLTNAISGIRWIKTLRTSVYKNDLSQNIYQLMA